MNCGRDSARLGTRVSSPHHHFDPEDWCDGYPSAARPHPCGGRVSEAASPRDRRPFHPPGPRRPPRSPVAARGRASAAPGRPRLRRNPV